MPIRRFPRFVSAGAALLAAAGTASAATLASGLLLSTDAERLDCFLANVGTKPLAIASVQIQNGGNTILSLNGNSCETLGPGANCTFSADLDARFSARAVVQTQGKATSLRGQCQLTSSTNHLIATTELR
jgi:hypothetical protein